MLFKIKFLLFCFALFSLESFASLSCDLLKNLDNPILFKNNKFWEEYSELASQKKINDRSLQELFKKHNAEPSFKNIEKSISSSPLSYSTAKKADKEIAKLSKGLRKNYEEFMGIMSDRSGIKKLYDNPGKWRMEKLTKPNEYSARLNDDVRVHFHLEKNEIRIIQVNADDVHAL